MKTLPSIPRYSKASKNRAYVRLNGQWVGLGHTYSDATCHAASNR
jgi:hypothetical protein